jgi:hypothetical protein
MSKTRSNFIKNNLNVKDRLKTFNGTGVAKHKAH